jgi:S-adenosylmethionine:tRNA ribosyltransferase-isomerase
VDPALFDYELPEGQVAQEPSPRREDARLLLLPRARGPVAHRRFAEIPELLSPGDLLVLNDTRVVPARLWGRKTTGGRVELLVLPAESGVSVAPGEEPTTELRRCLVRASRRPRPGEEIHLPDGVVASIVEEGEWGEAQVRFQGGPVAVLLERHGQLPLPPYIHRDAEDSRSATDRKRYQTVFAREDGAVAAPTAGLHFDEPMLEALHARGIETAMLTLHVGPGTFRPVAAARAENHVLPPERFSLGEATASAVRRARRRGGRIVACGTTVVRTLEARADDKAGVRPGKGECSLFILPGHRFRVVDGILTNFHLPRTTLLMLVCAFAGRRRVLEAYRSAVTAGYRFYSYGDAMLMAPAQDDTL